jgi:hypothetical protein
MAVAPITPARSPALLRPIRRLWVASGVERR